MLRESKMTRRERSVVTMAKSKTVRAKHGQMNKARYEELHKILEERRRGLAELRQ